MVLYIGFYWKSLLIENNADNLRRWVLNPQQIKAGCLMPAFGLSDKERDDVVRYLQTLR